MRYRHLPPAAQHTSEIQDAQPENRQRPDVAGRIDRDGDLPAGDRSVEQPAAGARDDLDRIVRDHDQLISQRAPAGFGHGAFARSFRRVGVRWVPVRHSRHSTSVPITTTTAFPRLGRPTSPEQRLVYFPPAGENIGRTRIHPPGVLSGPAAGSRSLRGVSGGNTTGSGTGIVQTSRRGRGRPPRLSRDRIVAAARALPPETLTMKAVADALGVDRKSLNYYVSDRDGLLELVALDAFETEFRRLALPAEGDWRQLLRLFAAAVAEALTQVGVLISYVRFGGRGGLSTLAAIERIFQSLVGAGFEPMEAGRTLRLLADIAYSAAREAAEATRGHVDIQAEHVARTLNSEAGQEFPLLRQVATTRESAARVGEQFEFDLELVIAGLERKLEARGRA
ncbi:hypothetical protein C5E51_01410 [Nocardia nova]|nr:hypothetical protein C5E51_01410 [Nocardia nova]